MFVAIPVNEKDTKAKVSPSFGRAAYFYIYDSITKSGKFLENEVALAGGEAGVRAARKMIDNCVKIIISPRYGENTANVLINGNIKVYKNIDGNIEENIDAWEHDKLPYLADIHSGSRQ